LVRVEAENAVFTGNGKEYRYPIANLSVPDRLFVNKATYAQKKGLLEPAAAMPATSAVSTPATAVSGKVQLTGQTLNAGGQNEIEFLITDQDALKTVKDAYQKPSTKAKMLLALPGDFDPAGKIFPFLIVSATTDGGASSIGSGKSNYLPDATNKGYVVLAVDGEFGKPPEQGDSTDFRWALVSSALAVLNKEWPKSKSWPIVTAGVSGGGGYASHQAMMLLQKQFPVIGLLLAVTGWTPTDFIEVLRRTPFAPLHNLPVFMTAGESDQIATKAITQKAKDDMTKEGFRNIRFEYFAGGHELHRPHLQSALDWFRAENEKAKGTTRK
jgi:hypothetical protein